MSKNCGHPNTGSRRRQRYLLLLALALAACKSPEKQASGPLPALVPFPARLELRPGTFVITGATRLAADPSFKTFSDELRVPLDPKGTIVFESADLPGDGYSLSITPDRIVAKGSEAGLFYASRTLLQLKALHGNALPALVIGDSPRYRWRGLHLDVARHFFPARDVMRLLELMAYFKLNVFHWHLTDDQGWRLPVDGHPELTSLGPAYTAAEIRDVVAFAAERNIAVVPEVELPSHTRALLASHPELSCRGKPLPVPTTWGNFEDVLCAGNPATYVLVDEILKSTAALFPGPYLHIGGDEVFTARWDTCPKCKTLGPGSVQTVFQNKVSATVRALGKRPVGWDEVLDHQPPSDLVVMAWRSLDPARKALAAGHDVVLNPMQLTYLSQAQSPYDDDSVAFDAIAAFEPSAQQLEGDHLLGIQAALWTEYIADLRTAELLLFPRLLAVAEVGWSDAAVRKAHPLAERMARARTLLDRLAVGAFIDPPLGLEPRKAFIGKGSLELRAGPGAVIRYTLDGSDPTAASARYEGPIALDKSADVSARVYLGDKASGVAHGRVVVEAPLPAVKAKTGGAGFRFAVYDGSFTTVPDFDALTPVRSGVSATALPAGLGERNWGLRLEALVMVPADGVYRFGTTSDDGSRLFVDQRLVVDNDGVHAPRARSGEIALGKGLHRLRVEFFQRVGGFSLQLDLAGLGPLAEGL